MNIKECSLGSYCNSEASYGNILTLQCPPGFYSNHKGRKFCLKCPNGFYCDEFGLSYPVECPPGFECLDVKNISPIECSKGFHCSNILTNLPVAIYKVQEVEICRKEVHLYVFYPLIRPTFFQYNP